MPAKLCRRPLNGKNHLLLLVGQPHPRRIGDDGVLRRAGFVQDNDDAGQAAAGAYPDAPRELGQFLYRLRLHIRGFTDHVIGKQLLDFGQEGDFSQERMGRSRAKALFAARSVSARNMILSM